MTVVPTPAWENFLTMRASARWTPEPADEEWEVTPAILSLEGGRRYLMVGARATIVDAPHEVTVQLALVSKTLSNEDARLFDDQAILKGVAEETLDLVWERVMVTAIQAASLLGATLQRRWSPPEAKYARMEG